MPQARDTGPDERRKTPSDAIADADDAREYEERHGVNPRSAGDLLQGLTGP